ncbi:MAG TPA: WXG100 family type VII secretion target [Mycobacteriales bacterium]|nr:WXG100 family type VII secretion target [Mycobacteriales bacterium]
MGSRIGGDIEGLWALRDHLTGVANDILDSSDHLHRQVDRLAGDASWSGDAADDFKATWDRDVGAAVGVADTYNSVGTIVGTLADTLHNLEVQLDGAEATARKADVPVPANGGPMIGRSCLPSSQVLSAPHQEDFDLTGCGLSLPRRVAIAARRGSKPCPSGCSPTLVPARSGV